MADTFPEPYANAGGDEVTTAPQKGDRSLLAAERETTNEMRERLLKQEPIKEDEVEGE